MGKGRRVIKKGEEIKARSLCRKQERDDLGSCHSPQFKCLSSEVKGCWRLCCSVDHYWRWQYKLIYKSEPVKSALSGMTAWTPLFPSSRPCKFKQAYKREQGGTSLLLHLPRIQQYHASVSHTKLELLGQRTGLQPVNSLVISFWRQTSSKKCFQM